MPGGTLEQPESADELYLARGGEVNEHRPYLQGDVFREVAIPGLGDDSGLAIILTHPCSMRKGATLVARQLVARVRETPELPFDQWVTGHHREMPLPALLHEEPNRHFSASFEAVGAVESEALVNHERIACLDPRGMCLLQQRFVFYMTRLAPPTWELLAVIEPVLEETELMEEWVGSAARHGGASREEAEASFHGLIREAPEGMTMTLQSALEEPTRRAAVRRIVLKEIQERFG
jgi:hypothetical protein